MEWGSIADWVSGLGSLSAAGVALWVAHYAQKIRLQGHCGHRVIVGGGTPKAEVFLISVTNVSQRPTVITNIGFSFGVWPRKRYCMLTLARDQFSSGVPKPLGDGETGTWSIPLDADYKWLKDLAQKLEASKWSVHTWRVHVYTSNGGTTTLIPENNIRSRLLACIKAPING